MTRPDDQTTSLTTRALPEIGSDFELVEEEYLIPIESQRLPWEVDSDILYVESGRQALAVVEAELRRQGHTRLYVPSYLCDTMIAPFQRNNWTLTVLSVDGDLVVGPTDLLAQVTGGVLLHTPYFGRQDSAAMLDALEAIRRSGVVVVVDETHRVFSGPSPVANIRVASLRKLLPLYDGGYVAGLSARLHPDIQTSPSKSDSAALRQEAMRAKSDALASGDESKAHLELFARAEHETEIRTEPVRMSGDSLSLLRRLDVELIRATREKNSISLAQALGQSDRFRVINLPTEDLLPSHLVLETDDVRGLRHNLIEKRIYCPVHWPPSELLPRTEDWPARYISLPIDHRYRERDMLRMADSIKAFFARDQKGSAT